MNEAIAGTANVPNARRETWREIAADAFVVHSIGPWTARTALDPTERAYQSAFAGRTDTLLVRKTLSRDLTFGGTPGRGPVAPGGSASSLARVLGGVARPARCGS